ncbi:MAG: Valyl-tRNA synthetase [Parcubacteria group bacterium GW2011_GWA2_33_14]|uniref:Valine--tRNA ligase n=1 Tax=Candidatus Staskawiczbacteria bacterium RIFCSPHIGHO2_02_FULL_33_16 TaxID=1802204 RepID=A0A1G2HXL8_9BACT|nr:MAG: Valyl-tRNA synthetase [Parcubacteria group bacterium GW2011_GWA2_33_14]OGZ67235.1 MAG: valine--tRNA ligase [Candidatus Staskawiczbacteria bacterium RIFCSPHIGHO2_02_FULL_33_16]OGZ70918.1 MAG: valine--tRNA ligase [Candidatus Staskawiczbacteria bacterium RIFCSPLOWO2_01_FULL_33_13]
MKLSGPYDPKKVEDKIYKLWEDSGFFNPLRLTAQGKLKRKKAFTIIMPPANANGNLHAGHALVMTIEDIMTRYKRMRGFKALWLPGLDHAGFETQVVYEKKLEKEGRSRFKMSPEELYKEILQFTLENKRNIEGQIKKMGASTDWSREKFTLDPEIIKIVYGTFEKLFDDGLVYRGKKIINWCVKHQTSLSDLETKDTEKIDKLYYLKYGPFIIATARPETKFGDKYVVMHPKDLRYADFKNGQKINLEWINGPVEAIIVKDEAIDMEFGTGVMTITPWHDAVDFGIAEKHHLQKEQVIDFYGKLLPIAGEFEGMKILEARQKIIEKLKIKGLVEKIEENYTHTVKTCYKCESVIEPQIKEQWFLKMKPLADPVIKLIEKNRITFIPEHYKKISLHWLKNIIDWPLSRQIVWGIPIPAKICATCQRAIVDIEGNKYTCVKCQGILKKDTDTFDTWFSSGQWPFATLKASQNKKDFKNFYPTDVMETAGEIIFFWVARMMMLSLYVTKKLPFKTVYLHGLVLDAKGQKMSKSKGNVINPLEITEKYGTDALRMGLVMGNTPGQSLALNEDKIKGYKNFANKIWNASKFVMMNLDDYNPNAKIFLNATQKKHLKELQKLTKECTKLMDEFKFYYAAEKIYHYFWHSFCDKIIEDSKVWLANDTLRQSTQYMLLEILLQSLKMLHPFMPFITEEIYQQLPIKDKKKSLMIENWTK